MTYIWIAVFVVAVIVEFATVQLVSVWFAVGALASFVLSICRVDEVWIQIVVFALVSLVSLIATRPLIKKLNKKTKRERTNADMNIGLEGVVTQTIDDTESTGLVKVRGAVWSAKSRDGKTIPSGTKIRVLSIEGVKLVVDEI